MASDNAPHHHNPYNDDDDEDDDHENDAVNLHLNPNLNNNHNNTMNHHHIIHFNNSNKNNNNSTNLQNDTVVDDDEDDDVDVDDDDVDDDSTSSTDPPPALLNHPPPPLPPPVPVTSGHVTIALPIPDQRLNDVTIAAASAAATVVGEKKPYPIDEARKLFQRLWTDEDEIELLQGFLDYTTQRGANNPSHHHDTTVFYDLIKNKLQLDFNKNQLVEKLRRLKKKYRNVMQKMGSGKEYVFKSPHDQATFEISRKIWSGTGSAVRNSGGGGGGGGSAAVDEGGFDDDDPSPNPNPNFTSALIDYSPNPNGVDDRKIPIRSRKRSRGGIGGGLNTTPQFNQQQQQPQPQPQPQPVAVGVATPNATATATATATAVPNVIEETVRSCLSPIFKELLQSVMNLNNNGGPRGLGGLALSPMPLGLGFGVGGGIGGVDLTTDERWRKQQILELEVFSRRLELVQDQIKSQLDELRGNAS